MSIDYRGLYKKLKNKENPVTGKNIKIVIKDYF